MTPELRTVRLSEIIFDEIIYPRHEHDAALVQRYADSLDEIEAAQKFISLGADMKLLDGKHRWLAYRKRFNGEDRDIRVLVYPVKTPHEQLQLAAKLNSDHGWQLTEDDKEYTAKSLYAYGYSYETIAAALSVGKAKVTEWLASTVRDNKERRNRKIIDMWMACHTQEEIAEATECTQPTAKSVIDDFINSVPGNQTYKTAADHLTDFTPPLYNIWRKNEITSGASHPGNSEVRWVDNLLYAYTKPFDIVVDPFAGSGSTLDICRKRFRRYWISDRRPAPERGGRIRKHDLTEGLPHLPRWKDVALVYLDPPYWRQAEGWYGEGPTNLANMPLEDFNRTLSGIINDFGRKLRSGAHVALIIQPTQWNAPDRRFTDHVFDMLRLVRMPAVLRISAPYGTQQCTPQMVEWAKENRTFLVLSREIVVWKVA